MRRFFLQRAPTRCLFRYHKRLRYCMKIQIIKNTAPLEIRGNNILYFIQNFLSNKNVTVRIGNTLSSSHTQYLKAQFSATLFNIAINDLPQIIPPQVFKSLLSNDSVPLSDAETLQQVKNSFNQPRIESISGLLNLTFLTQNPLLSTFVKTIAALKLRKLSQVIYEFYPQKQRNMWD